MFSRDAALRAAMLVFWRHGFDGASYADLTAATGMSKPTLYAHFGDKVNLFREAVMLYSRESARVYGAALDRPSAREAVRACLQLSRGVAPGPADEPVVCFLVQGALFGSADTQELRDELNALRRQATHLLRLRLERAQREGDLPGTAHPAALAEYFVAISNGLSVQSAAGASPQLLGEVIELALSSWPASDPP